MSKIVGVCILKLSDETISALKKNGINSLQELMLKRDLGLLSLDKYSNNCLEELADVCERLDDFHEDYPDHCDHFFSKYIPGIFDGEREIITCYIDNKIAAVAILKKDTEERKISTLFVKPEYQKRGIATELLEKCFAWLETTRPVITIADYKLDQFAKVIEKYGWTETEVLADGYYNDHSREHVFNG